MSRRIAVFTGTRADYGLLRGLIRELADAPDVELQLIVSGSHLSDAHGRTVKEIERDGVPIAASVPIWRDDDSAPAATRDVGDAVGRYGATLDTLNPDALVVLGDRLEALAVALAATILGIPVAHVHGGEVTEGAMDESLRHAITKLSYLHFTSTASHRDRVVQLGEEPDRVFFVGAPIVDAVASLDLLSRDELRDRFGIRLARPTILVTFHPASADVLPPLELLEELLGALEAVTTHDVIVTGSNTDIGSNAVRERIARFVAEHPHRVDFVESFGQLGYLSAMSASAVVVGNSSSTVLEAPVIGVPSVLVGDRQRGRPLAASVATPAPDREAIATAIREARPVDGGATELFGTPGFAKRTAEILRTHDLPRYPRKPFHDVPLRSSD